MYKRFKARANPLRSSLPRPVSMSPSTATKIIQSGLSLGDVIDRAARQLHDAPPDLSFDSRQRSIRSSARITPEVATMLADLWKNHRVSLADVVEWGADNIL